MMEKTGRNEPCPCGSGKKYKQCCLKKAVDVGGRRKFKAAVLSERTKPISAVERTFVSKEQQMEEASQMEASQEVKKPAQDTEQ